MDRVFPGHDSEFQGALRKRLEEHDVAIATGATVAEVDGSRIHFEEHDALDYDVCVWTGGVTGQDALENAALNKDYNGVYADAAFRTSDERVFAVGDAALVEQDEEVAPLSEEAIWAAILEENDKGTPTPTAEAAWQAAAVAAENVVRAVRGDDLETGRYRNKGTLVSVGNDVVAHDVLFVPVNTFGGLPARILKRTVSARWIGTISSWGARSTGLARPVTVKARTRGSHQVRERELSLVVLLYIGSRVIEFTLRSPVE